VSDHHDLVADLGDYVKSVCDAAPGKKIFLIGQSMGGGLSVLATAAGGCLDGVVAGMVLMAPMCAIGEAMRPANWKICLLTWAAWAFPVAPVAPVPSVAHLAFSDPAARRRCELDAKVYHGGLRLATAQALYAARSRRAYERMNNAHV
jgi:alpha-beta hydrolase superfamily lysophospholipase